MKLVATVGQMRECDRVTIEEIGIPGIVLMETASRAAAEKARQMLGGDAKGKRVICLCGKGNNGGDGFAMARHLRGWGAEVEVHLTCQPESLQGDAALNRDFWLRTGGKINVVAAGAGISRIDWHADLIVDALLGTGFAPPLNAFTSQLIQKANDSSIPILGVDIPSGVSGDSGEIGELAINAKQTVTFGLLKPGLILPPGRMHAGEVTVADIGIPTEVVARQNIALFHVEATDDSRLLPSLSSNAHKGDAGLVYILAGSPGMTGAATLVAEAALKTGAGLVTVGVPKSLNPILEVKLTEAMTDPLPETASGGLARDSWQLVAKRLVWADAVAFGPGVGKDDETGDLLGAILTEIKKPLVIDADGLNILAKMPELMKLLSGKTVLTPHPGEFSRLTGLPIAEITRNPVLTARKYSAEWGVVIHLKGAPSITASPDGTVFINSTGNPGMATGGSGDVLTGIIVALLAGGLAPLEATWAGAYIHGRAGDLARDTFGERSMIAGDIISHLPAALRI